MDKMCSFSQWCQPDDDKYECVNVYNELHFTCPVGPAGAIYTCQCNNKRINGGDICTLDSKFRALKPKAHYKSLTFHVLDPKLFDPITDFLN